jgi:hypothetical protein
MSISIDLILDECLEQIRQGESLESCLAAHPQQEEWLRPLLETASAVRTAAFQRAPETAVQKGRERMFAMIDQEFPQQPVSENALSRYTVRLPTWITGKENIDMKLVTRFVIAFALVLVVIASLGTTAVSASSALPGDLLYPLKTSAQNAQLILTWDTQARQALEQHFQEEYRNDVRALLSQGRQVQVRFAGTLDAIDGSRWIIGGLPVSIDPATASSSSFQLGDVILVEATVQKDGSILASHLALSNEDPRSGNSAVTPEHTPTDTAEPEHTPMHTAEPEHTQEDQMHSSSTEMHVSEPGEHMGTATLQPTRMPESTAMPQPTVMPVQPMDGGMCQNCGGTGGHDGGGHHSGHH